MKFIKGLLLSALCFGLMGTTFIIKEGDKEVGRYDENDGKTETVVLDNGVPKPAPPRPKKAAPAPEAVKASAPSPEELARKAAEQITAEVKKRNDARQKEAEQAIKEMEEGYK